MKLIKIIIFSVLLESIYAQYSNTNLTKDVAQNFNKRNLNIIKFSLQRWTEVATIKLIGHECKGSIKNGFYKWKWTWSAEWKCPDLTSIVGYSTNYKSKKIALEYALNDFIFKAIQANVINIKKLKSSANHAKYDANKSENSITITTKNVFIF